MSCRRRFHHIFYEELFIVVPVAFHKERYLSAGSVRIMFSLCVDRKNTLLRGFGPCGGGESRDWWFVSSPVSQLALKSN